ncbi:MerC domain-containing protein [Rheinheimera mesophila]|uniref:MerC domain-containing protein n=1 Tax=Rheinheimera mesophila TaxID=1547515 RepID=A0A3P3QJ61_9GAMM|nr:MerC domain-containing protein [Rheinheimera mesophila]KKL01329.1 MerC mercury resistance protein [Rheinheimera mesophila]RRJ21212.1 MerC domain-containing protein [Rheinheimera mesophila]
MKDLLGACLSGLCILHCLFTPVLLALGGVGVIGSWLGSEWVHYLLLAPIALILVWSLPLSWIKHRNTTPLCIGALGFSLLLMSLFVPESAEPVIAVLAGFILIAAHLLNRRLLNTSTPHSLAS